MNSRALLSDFMQIIFVDLWDELTCVYGTHVLQASALYEVVKNSLLSASYRATCDHHVRAGAACLPR